MWFLVDCSSHLVLGIHPGRGPGSDIPGAVPLLARATKYLKLKLVVADAGFDSEGTHQFLNQILKTRIIIPPLTSTHKSSLPRKPYRRKMAMIFRRGSPKAYRQRWQVETAVSMIKRTISDSLSARSYNSQNRELALLAITHNLGVLLLFMPFLQSTTLKVAAHRSAMLAMTGHAPLCHCKPCKAG